MNNEEKRKLIRAVVAAMYSSYRIDPLVPKNKIAVNILTDDLMDTQLDFECMSGLIKIAKQKCAFCPVLADIIQPMREEQTNKEHSDIDKCWIWFKSHAFNPVQKLPDWAYTIRKHLGQSRLAACTDRDIPFVEKQFRELMLRYMANEIEPQSDKGGWKKVGNSWMLMPSRCVTGGPVQLKNTGIFKNQLIGA